MISIGSSCRINGPRHLFKFSKTALSSSSSFSSSTINDNDAFIISAARTPIGRFRGKLSQLTAPKLGSIAIKAAFERSGLKKEDIQEAMFGNTNQTGVGQNPARQAVLGAGLLNSVPCTTLNKACSSGMKSYISMAQAIQCGHIDVGVVGGQEVPSQIPFLIPRGEIPYGGMKIIDGIIFNLTDPNYKVVMGTLAEKTVQKMNISREQQDDYAMESYRRAADAEKRMQQLEIVPVEIPATKKNLSMIVDEDEEYKFVDFDKFRTLQPRFLKEGGTITAGNASKINDGAAAAIMASGRAVKKFNLKPLAKIIAYSDAAFDAEDFTIAPAAAIQKILDRTTIKKEQISFWEINEAFSVVPLANIKIMKLDPNKVNVHGGAVSLGHPVGMSGARITNHLALFMEPGQYGLATICNAMGGASAILMEKM